MYDNIADDLVRKILCGNSILHEVCYVVFTFLPVALDIIICQAPLLGELANEVRLRGCTKDGPDREPPLAPL